jgi:type II secretory pathway component PulF
MVLLLALILFSFTLVNCFPVIQQFYDSVSPDGGALVGLQWLADWQPIWPRAVALIAIASLVVWFVRQRRALKSIQSSGRPWRRRRRATVGNVIYWGRLAVLTETLATLIEHEVPLPESLRLAADACGDRRLGESVRQLADALEAGVHPSNGASAPHAPRLLGLLLTGGSSPQRLAATLRRMSQSYRQLAMQMSRWVAVYLPLLLTVAIGGTATIAYALSVIWPFASILWELGQPGVR